MVYTAEQVKAKQLEHNNARANVTPMYAQLKAVFD
ncbi:hypothetical protein H310_03291 [Aphanomyces invadans]|uniref:Uncharacterized protein n=1 Tax=Aphanomyces invadans TaxID=157072 RepID=A0A024UGX4_9STRA|nr:hypothetical protein H310_03291 [Aphanomyces invadans]ETW05539.1 hypothetical protein H310_03291 [Aphanomyces invadans]|eukprot:XP_008865316.1 hypothetical protein H310_03291 [Aphanomyces invadans]